MKSILLLIFAAGCLLASRETAAGGTLVYTRDTAGRVVGTSTGAGGVTYSYDHAGSLLARNGIAVAGADLSLTQSAFPDAPTAGVPFYIFLNVANLGSTTATLVQLSDTLPSGLTLVGVGLSQGTYSVNGSTLTCPLGTLAAGASATVVLQLKATAAGSITHTAAVTTSATDPVGGNNSASLALGVLGSPALALSVGSQTGQLSWSAAAENFVLEETGSLRTPVVWTPLAVPSLFGGTLYVPVTRSGPIKFYRLRQP